MNMLEVTGSRLRLTVGPYRFRDAIPFRAQWAFIGDHEMEISCRRGDWWSQPVSLPFDAEALVSSWLRSWGKRARAGDHYLYVKVEELPDD